MSANSEIDIGFFNAVVISVENYTVNVYIPFMSVFTQDGTPTSSFRTSRLATITRTYENGKKSHQVYICADISDFQPKANCNSFDALRMKSDAELVARMVKLGCQYRFKDANINLELLQLPRSIKFSFRWNGERNSSECDITGLTSDGRESVKACIADWRTALDEMRKERRFKLQPYRVNKVPKLHFTGHKPKSRTVPKALQAYYTTLGLKTDANDEQIKEAYKRLSLYYHPDRINKEPDDTVSVFAKRQHKAKRIMQSLNEAYSRLYKDRPQ